jgi:DNA replication protein DnaC
VLIIDEWLLIKPTETESRDIFELLHHRRRKTSTIFCSQYRDSDGYDQLGGDSSPLADAILDRIVHDAYKINIENLDSAKDISMHEIYGLDKELRK